MMKRSIVTAVAALAAIWAIVVTWRQNERAAGLDFYMYFVNAHLAARTDIDNIYSDETQERAGEEYYERGQRSDFDIWRYDSHRRRRLDTVSSPFLYTSLSWVSRDYRVALHQYHALVIAAFVAGVLMIGRASRVSWASTLFLLTALLLWYRGFEGDLRVGNVNSLQLCAIGAMLVTPPLVAGAIAGMLIAFKPNLILIPMLIAISRVATRDRKRLRLELLGGGAGVLIAIVAASVRYRSPGVWLQWLPRASEFYQRLPSRAIGNITPALPLYVHYGQWLSHLLFGVLIIIACVVIWRWRAHHDPLIAGMAVLIYVMSALVVWPHYLVLLLVVAIPLLRWRATAVVSLLALLLVAQEPLLHIAGIAPPPDWRFITPALLMLFVAGLWALSRSGVHPSAAGGRSARGGEDVLLSDDLRDEGLIARQPAGPQQ